MDTLTTPKADLPASVVAQVSLDCHSDYAETPSRHRIWIHRDGSVTTPDHKVAAEDAFTALGGILEHPCAYWSRASKSANEAPYGGVAPAVRTWNVDRISSSWTTKSMWTFHQALMGRSWADRMDPARSLSLVQTYLAHGELPTDLARQLMTLHDPAARGSGFRRQRPTSAEELNALLSAGVPNHLAADLAACDFDHDTASRALSQTRRLGLKDDMIIHLATLFTPGEATGLLDQMSTNDARYLPQRLTIALQHDTMTRRQVQDYLLTGRID